MGNPEEWNINDAYIADGNGKKIVNFKDSNLHVVSYSIPVDELLSFDELKKYLLQKISKCNPISDNLLQKRLGILYYKNQYDELESLGH